MTNFSQKIIDVIKEKHIAPKPRWYYLMLHVFMWIAIGSAILMGSFAFGIVIRHFTQTDWEMTQMASGGSIQSILIILPYIWFALLILILFLAQWLFHHTEKGYKIRPLFVIAGIILISLLGGFASFATHLDEPFERGMRKNMPFYESYLKGRARPFVNAGKGVLTGEIIKVSSEDMIILKDLKDEEWNVDIRDVKGGQKKMELEEGLPIGVVGKRLGPGEFKAKRLLPPPPFLGNQKFERKLPPPAYE